MEYEVSTTGGMNIIMEKNTGLRVEVTEKVGKVLPVNKPYCMATVYQVKGGFIPEKVLLFETVNGTDLVVLKEAVDHYCRDFLQTELYVKEVPPESNLFKQEALRLYGTVSIICRSGTE